MDYIDRRTQDSLRSFVRTVGVNIGFSNRGFPRRVTYMSYPFVLENDWILDVLDKLRRLGYKVCEVTGLRAGTNDKDRKFKLCANPHEQVGIILLNGQTMAGRKEVADHRSLLRTSLTRDKYTELKLEKTSARSWRKPVSPSNLEREDEFKGRETRFGSSPLGFLREPV